MNSTLVEALGWIAMFITISSFFFQQMKTLRIVNFVGCLVWMIYGTLIVSAPIVLTNVAIVLTHAFWFMKNSKAVDSIK
jgi:hypothetical protein